MLAAGCSSMQPQERRGGCLLLEECGRCVCNLCHLGSKTVDEDVQFFTRALGRRMSPRRVIVWELRADEVRILKVQCRLARL